MAHFAVRAAGATPTRSERLAQRRSHCRIEAGHTQEMRDAVESDHIMGHGCGGSAHSGTAANLPADSEPARRLRPAQENKKGA
ncbi:hypothetical protein L500_0672 [Bordetella holmesii CDC-H643-BH]|uniref:Uncharacterized protein n=1 Tax=Bordetella holmesii CDC-H585-BH TaxID=1331206 RepID=A0A158M4K9_9BORD|nr:hypothetical protein D558_0105 [Bordetella holmesii 44057]KAK80860.1 hypothetical protein L503_1818 [Bordetella holmesii CDC-H809-BH]KAK88444.1 hypothetical protein L496_1801 [Bordetella holmesii CDC-H572-BH]KAK90494.1 hypothetical protein L497_1795 [Bordetella holmesii CDC-H585-BH]KCV06665.1 hypothetical protein L498_0649 [Bordetella holmesii CDC-H629-BH]KCV08983.1 hypothetical protein L502_1830 [Bordetella holmesii CDC-H785-BH]KCV09703.1 hypothetical protein AZ25_0663 [Bordetella holmesi